MEPLGLLNENIRVAHTADEKLLAAPSLSALQTAVADLSWLSNRGCTVRSLLILAGSL